MNGSSLTSASSPSDSRIVVDCPECHRTIWAGTRCLHGAFPTEPTGNNADAGVVLHPLVDPPGQGDRGRGLRGGTGR